MDHFLFQIDKNAKFMSIPVYNGFFMSPGHELKTEVQFHLKGY